MYKIFIMSRSTPIAQLRKNKLEPESDETLVNEILKEIETPLQNDTHEQNNEMSQQAMMEHQHQQQQQQHQQQQQQQQQYAMMEQQQQQAMMEQQQQQQAMMQEQGMMEQNPNNQLDPHLQEIENNQISFIDSIYGELKSILVVMSICVVISLPQINGIISKLLPNKEIIMNNLSSVLIILKAILGGILYLLAHKFA